MDADKSANSIIAMRMLRKEKGKVKTCRNVYACMYVCMYDSVNKQMEMT